MMIGDVWLSAAMVPELSKSLCVHRTTVQRWMKRRRLPARVYALLDITENGNLARIHRAWEGWRINPRTGYLVTPQPIVSRSRNIKPGEIMSQKYRYQAIKVLQNQVDKLEARCQQLYRRNDELEAYLSSIDERNVQEWARRNLALRQT